MGSKDNQSGVSWVPLEIWRHVIFKLDVPSLSYSDLALTWINLRGVSSFFQAEIEALFLESVLPGMEIDFWLKPDLESKVREYASSDFQAVFNNQLQVPKPSSTLQRRIRCTLSQVCKDNGLATFHPDRERPVTEKRTVVFDQAFEMLEKLCRPHVEGPFAQHYMLQVSGVHNNLVIPGMRVRKRGWEMSFDWRKLFSKLFSEEKVAMELAKLSDETTEELLRRERYHHCLPDDGDLRSHLRSKRFRNWYDHQCNYIAHAIPGSDYFDLEKVAQRLLEGGLREYHLRFDREKNRLPVIPWQLRRYGIVLPGDTDVGSSADDSSLDSSDDYDPSVDGENYDDVDYEMDVPTALPWISQSVPYEVDDLDVLGVPMAQYSISRRAPVEEHDHDAASEPDTLEHSMPANSSE